MEPLHKGGPGITTELRVTDCSMISILEFACLFKFLHHRFQIFLASQHNKLDTILFHLLHRPYLSNHGVGTLLRNELSSSRRDKCTGTVVADPSRSLWERIEYVFKNALGMCSRAEDHEFVLRRGHD